jgi:hypothetical protein
LEYFYESANVLVTIDVEGSSNNHYPEYEFSTEGIATNFYNEENVGFDEK